MQPGGCEQLMRIGRHIHGGATRANRICSTRPDCRRKRRATLRRDGLEFTELEFSELDFRCAIVGGDVQAKRAKTGIVRGRPEAGFMAAAEKELGDLQVKANQAQWVSENFITDDTEALSAELTKNLNVTIQRLALDAKRFDTTTLPATLRRKFSLLKLLLTAPPPSDLTEAAELSRLTSSMPSTYGKGTYCRPAKAGGKQECLQINDLSRILATSTDPAELLDAWRGWHTVHSWSFPPGVVGGRFWPPKRPTPR